MRALSPPLRKQLESAVLAARRASESASRAAIDGLGVFAERRPEHLDIKQAALRNGLRAKWRQLGSDRELLVTECAYEQWHRLLFARFLAASNLLLHPQFQAPVTLEDCEDLAAELGEPDGWSVAGRFAAGILPGIFRLDDPCVRLRLAPEGRHDLERIIAGLPAEVFAAEDALGWVYQFWQKDKKDEINASERKISGADLGPVTQLFTENYMVRFLLENSLGAWWASRHPDSPLVRGFEYLRLMDDYTPAADCLDGWPDRVAEVTVIDPCCGSGHFLVEAFSMLWQMRAEEEGLSPVDAQDAVLRDNLYGLELDPRCVQIAMFAVALQAWKAGGGWRQLPVPNVACSGIPVKAASDEWKALASGDALLATALARLHVLFRNADTLGSLIDPKRATEAADLTEGGQKSLDDVAWEDLSPLLENALSSEAEDPATAVLGADAAGIARAADYLSRRFTLACTNPPFLSDRKQGDVLSGHAAIAGQIGSEDLATTLLVLYAHRATTVAFVTPYVWLALNAYEQLRRFMLNNNRVSIIAAVGARAFSTPMYDFNTALSVSSMTKSRDDYSVTMVDATDASSFDGSIRALRQVGAVAISRNAHLAAPKAVVAFRPLDFSKLLGDYAASYAGIQPGDTNQFVRRFWEGDEPTRSAWRNYRSTPLGSSPFAGCSKMIAWTGEGGSYQQYVTERLGAGNEAAWIRGRMAWGADGVVVGLMGNIPVGLYDGSFFDDNVAVLVPKRNGDLAAIWHFLASPSFATSLRSFNKKASVKTQYLLQVPFDVDHWRTVATEAGHLPKPWSNDPTQWLFTGRPEVSTAPLHVALGRLVGFRWPGQAEADDLDAFADSDGIVCLPSVAGEPPAADRVQQALATAFGETWSPTRTKGLLEQAGSRKTSVVDWLRDEFFKQHCALFGHRPFVWHVWDGRRDGFSAVVNYHRLNRKTLEKLIYTYLGQDWVERQRAGVRDETPGADSRLAAALELQRKLEAILAGEKPYDIYVRWKALHEQPVGWEPDLNDGVRVNIRPFVEAGVLRSPFNIHWKKDRGNNPDGSERHNDVHLSLAEKLDAQKGAGKS